MAIHKPTGDQSGIKCFLYAATVAWLPKNHSMSLGLAMDLTSIRSENDLKEALVTYVGKDMGQWDYLIETMYYDTVLGAMAEKPDRFALPAFSLQQIAMT